MSKKNELQRKAGNAIADIWRKDYNLPLTAVQQEMIRLFDRMYNGIQVHATDWDQRVPSMPSVNILETPDSFRVDVELAGMSPEDISVETSNGYLTVSGERRDQKSDRSEEKGVNYLCEEIRYGSFSRSIALPDASDTAKAKASFKNGILSITIPHRSDAKQKPRKIDVREAA